MMRKYWMFLFTLFTAITLLMGCSNDATTNSSNEQNNQETSEMVENVIKITISKDEGEEVIKETEIEIEENDILMDVMKEHFEIEEEGGFIHSINGIHPEEGEQKAWMYFVNDDMAMVGAAEYELSPGDHVVFDLQAWE